MKYQDLERNPGYQLWLATNAWQRIIRKALEPLELTHVQFVMLASVDLLDDCRDKAVADESSPCVTQAIVSRFAGTDENMTSQVVRSLAARGLVTRIEHPSDARARRLALTPAGAQLLAEAKAAILPAKDRFFSPLGDQSAELANLLHVIVEANKEE